MTLVAMATAASVYPQEVGPDDAVIIFNRGQDLHEKGDLRQAIAEYDKALKILPEFPEAEYQRAAAEIGLGDLGEAESSLRRATSLRADWPLAWGALGDVLVRKYASAPPNDRPSLLNDARSVLSHALELDRNNVSALNALVELQLSSGASKSDLSATLDRLRDLTDGKMSPASSLWAARAAIENAIGDKKAAKASAARALELDAKNIGAMFVAADLAVIDDIDLAKRLAADLALMKADPLRVGLLNARIAANEGRLSDAIAILDKIPQSSASDELRRQITAASATDAPDIEKLLASDDKNAALLNKLCSLYRRQDPMKALDYCRRASEAEPKNVAPAAGYAAALVQAKQYPSAIALIRRLLAMAPDNSTLHANLATALFELKQFPDAIKEFEWLSGNDPRSAAPYLFLGIIHDRMEEYVDALAAYEQYLRLADPVANKLDIDRVELRLPILRRMVKDGKGKKVRS